MMTQNNMLEWDQLSMKQRAAFIRNAVARGIYNVEDIVQDYNEFRKGGPKETPIYEDLPKMLKKAGLDIKVTSGYRPVGATGKAGSKSWHPRHGAVDIIPQGNTTFEDIENVLHNNPAIRQYMLSHNFGLIDESGRTPESKLTMKKTGATGAHFHIGKDSKYAALYRQRVGAAQPERDRGKTVYFTNPFLPLEQPTQQVQVQRTVTPEEILQSVVIPEPIKPDDDIQATVEIPEVEVIGHQPKVNPLTILSQIQESAPTPLVLEPYQIPQIQNKVNEIATQRNTFLQKDLEDRILAEERRRRLGYSYRDSSIEDDIKQMQFLRNMSANGGSLFGNGGDVNYADTQWHENWLNNRQEQFNENVSLKPRKFKKLGVDTVEGQINNLRNTEETYNTSEFRDKTGNSAPFMYKQYGIGAMTFPKADGSGNIIWYSPIYSGKPYEPLTLEKSYNKDMTQEDIDRWNRKQGYELAPEQEVMATRVHEWTHGLSPLDPNNPTNTGLLPQHEKIRRINKEMGITSTKTDGHTSLYDNDAYRNDVEETYAGIMQQRFQQGLDPKHHVELEEIQDWRDKGLLNEYLVGKPNEVLYRYFNEVAENAIPMIQEYGIPRNDVSPNITAYGGRLFELGGDTTRYSEEEDVYDAGSYPTTYVTPYGNFNATQYPWLSALLYRTQQYDEVNPLLGDTEQPVKLKSIVNGKPGRLNTAVIAPEWIERATRSARQGGYDPALAVALMSRESTIGNPTNSPSTAKLWGEDKIKMLQKAGIDPYEVRQNIGAPFRLAELRKQARKENINDYPYFITGEDGDLDYRYNNIIGNHDHYNEQFPYYWRYIEAINNVGLDRAAIDNWLRQNYKAKDFEAVPTDPIIDALDYYKTGKYNSGWKGQYPAVQREYNEVINNPQIMSIINNTKALGGNLFPIGGPIITVNPGDSVNTDQCAAWSNGLLRDNGYLVNGNAWNLGNVDMLFNGYDGLTKPEVYDSTAVTNYNHAATDNVFKNFDSKTLDTSKPYVVNMYYNNSPAQEDAYNNGEGVTGTHTGVLTFDPEVKKWYVTHNIHGNIHQEPFVDLQKSSSPYGVTAIYSPREKSLWNRFKGLLGFAYGGQLNN